MTQIIPTRLMGFLDAVQAELIQGQPYRQLRHHQAIIAEALRLGIVGVFYDGDVAVIGFTEVGHFQYCQQCTINMSHGTAA